MLLDAFAYILANPTLFRAALVQHLWLSGLALAGGALIAIPLGLSLGRTPRAAAIAISAAGVLRTFPNLAVLALLLPFVGTGTAPSLIALVIYGIPPILVNTYLGIRQVDADIVDAAEGMGFTRLQTIFRVQIPLAAPVIFAGIRTAAVQVVAGATLAAFIGGGGLGDFITAGIAIMDMSRLMVGAIPVAALSISTELLFSGLERVFFNAHTKERTA